MSKYKIEVTFSNDLNHITTMQFIGLKTPEIKNEDILYIVTKEKVYCMPLRHILYFTSEEIVENRCKYRKPLTTVSSGEPLYYCARLDKDGSMSMPLCNGKCEHYDLSTTDKVNALTDWIWGTNYE